MTSRCCDACGASYPAVRPSSRFCSSRCRTRAHRHPLAVLSPVSAVPVRSVVRAAVRSDLAAAGRDASYLGSIALGLASQIDASIGGMGVAALVKELKATMTAALAAEFSAPADPLDELRARRDTLRTQRTRS